MFDTVVFPLAFAYNLAAETCKDPLSSEAPNKSRLSRPMAPSFLLATAAKLFPESICERADESGEHPPLISSEGSGISTRAARLAWPQAK
jgi:hypothetical protein